MQRFVERLAPDRVRAITTTDEGVSVVDEMLNEEADEYGRILIAMAGIRMIAREKPRSP